MVRDRYQWKGYGRVLWFGYKSKKMSIFTKKDTPRLLVEASSDKYLIHVFEIWPVASADAKYLPDTDDQGTFIVVPHTKANTQRAFTLTDREAETIHYLEIYRKYTVHLPTFCQQMQHLRMHFEKSYRKWPQSFSGIGKTAETVRRR